MGAGVPAAGLDAADSVPAGIDPVAVGSAEVGVDGAPLAVGSGGGDTATCGEDACCPEVGGRFTASAGTVAFPSRGSGLAARWGPAEAPGAGKGCAGPSLTCGAGPTPDAEGDGGVGPLSGLGGGTAGCGVAGAASG